MQGLVRLITRAGIESLTGADRDVIASTTGYEMTADSQGGLAKAREPPAPHHRAVRRTRAMPT